MPGTAQSGRRPKSAKQHKLDGTFQRCRHAGIKTPEPPAGVPNAPKPLTGDALAEWNRMVNRLALVGTLSVVDDAALYQYACLFAEVEALSVTQAETAASIDIVEENLRGLEQSDLVAAFQEITKLRQLEARYVTQIRQGRMALRHFLVEFGMTPSARARIKLPLTKEADPFAEFEDGSLQ